MRASLDVDPFRQILSHSLMTLKICKRCKNFDNNVDDFRQGTCKLPRFPVIIIETNVAIDALVGVTEIIIHNSLIGKEM